MLGLSFADLPGDSLNVLCLGAHCDDIEIGCGATLRTLRRSVGEVRVCFDADQAGEQAA